MVLYDDFADDWAGSGEGEEGCDGGGEEQEGDREKL